MALIQIVENKKKSLGIYVHIPFCRSKCEYCDFYSIPGARSRDLFRYPIFASGKSQELRR